MKVFFVLLNVIHLVVSLSQSKLNIKFKVANKSKWDLLMKSSEILPPPRKETINLGILDSISSSKPWRSIAISMSLTSKPLATKTVTSMIVFSIGNFIAQTFFRKSPFNTWQLLQATLFGAFLHGPCGHHFYRWLERLIPGYGPRVVATKVVIDQMAYTPFLSCIFLLFIGLTAGFSPRQITELYREKLASLITALWCIWPLAHYLNFSWIAPKNRLLFLNMVQLISSVVMSKIAL